MGRSDLRHSSNLRAQKPARRVSSDAEIQVDAVRRSSNDLRKGFNKVPI